MFKRVVLTALLLTVSINPCLSAQDEEITVNEIEEPKWEWGRQRVYLDVSNNTDFLKLITIEGQLVIREGKSECRRDYRSAGYIEPQGSTVLKIDILVPGSYGDVEVRVALHDVIDTLDIILPGQEFFEKKFIFTLGRPTTAEKWKDLNPALPPRVKDHPYFDNSFATMMFAMFDEGLSKGEIAGLSNTGLQYVNSQIAQWVRIGVLSRGDEGIHSPLFPIIEPAEAGPLSDLAYRTAESLSSAIASNLTGYGEFLDSLASEGKVVEDSTSMYSGTSIFYRRYGMVGGIVLWYHLGSRFINGKQLFRAFKQDLCNSLNHDYMYMAPQGEAYNGQHLYAYLSFYQSIRIIFADHPIEINCPEDFKIGGSVGKQARWTWSEHNRPEVFMIDTAAAAPVLDKLGAGCDVILEAAGSELDGLAAKFGYPSESYGLRYWFWNLVATRCLNKMVEIGALPSGDPGHYEFNVRVGI